MAASADLYASIDLAFWPSNGRDRQSPRDVQGGSETSVLFFLSGYDRFRGAK